MPSKIIPNRPKNQKEISREGLIPSDIRYESNIPLGENPNQEQTGIEFNRSTKMSWRFDNQKDRAKPFSIGIQDIDEAIFYYFKNVIKPFVYQNGEKREVPVIYASPERWKSIRKDGYYRDAKGAIMLPIIYFKRNNITKNRALANKLDANNPNLYTTWKSEFNPHNFYSNFMALTNMIPSKKYYVTVVPDYVNITYTCTIQTYYIEQINKIIEAIEYASDAYWGDPERFKFKALIDSFETVNDVPENAERLVQSNFTLNLSGYLVPDTIQKNNTALSKVYSKSKVLFQMETTSDPSVFMTNDTVALENKFGNETLKARTRDYDEYSVRGETSVASEDNEEEIND